MVMRVFGRKRGCQTDTCWWLDKGVKFLESHKGTWPRARGAFCSISHRSWTKRRAPSFTVTTKEEVEDGFKDLMWEGDDIFFSHRFPPPSGRWEARSQWRVKGALGSQRAEQVSPSVAWSWREGSVGSVWGNHCAWSWWSVPTLGLFLEQCWGSSRFGGYWRSYWLPQMTDHLVRYAFKDARGVYQEARCEYYTARVTEFTGVRWHWRRIPGFYISFVGRKSRDLSIIEINK